MEKYLYNEEQAEDGEHRDRKYSPETITIQNQVQKISSCDMTDRGEMCGKSHDIKNNDAHQV